MCNFGNLKSINNKLSSDITSCQLRHTSKTELSPTHPPRDSVFSFSKINLSCHDAQALVDISLVLARYLFRSQRLLFPQLTNPENTTLNFKMIHFLYQSK